MTREELFQTVELLRDTAKLHQPNEEILTDVKAESFIFVMDSVLSALSVPEREKGEWILVAERLPEEGRSVLVCFKSQGGMAQDVSERFNINGEWRWSALGGRKPLAWQPLPEPYKAEMRC